MYTSENMCRGIRRAATAWRRRVILLLLFSSWSHYIIIVFPKASPQVNNNNSPMRRPVRGLYRAVPIIYACHCVPFFFISFCYTYYIIIIIVETRSADADDASCVKDLKTCKGGAWRKNRYFSFRSYILLYINTFNARPVKNRV